MIGIGFLCCRETSQHIYHYHHLHNQIPCFLYVQSGKHKQAIFTTTNTGINPVPFAIFNRICGTCLFLMRTIVVKVGVMRVRELCIVALERGKEEENQGRRGWITSSYCELMTWWMAIGCFR